MTTPSLYFQTVVVPAGKGNLSFRCHVSPDPVRPRGAVLMIHGRDGAADQPHMRALAQAYHDHGWKVAAPDLPHSRATPDCGAPEDLTMQGHARDAARALEAMAPRFPDGLPVALCGHSLGAYAIATMAASCPGLHHLMAVSPVLSGRALLAARTAMGPPAVAALEAEAPRLRATMEAESAEPFLSGLDVPVAVMTGGADAITPPADARAYFDAAPGARFFCVLNEQHHCPDGPVTARALTAALDAVGA